MSFKRYNFGYSQRLHGQKAFAAVLKARCRKSAGPIAASLRPNNLRFSRLGLSVPRKVGNAVTRNRIKRMVREAFRLSQHDWPGGYDIVVFIRPHDPASLNQYVKMLGDLFQQGHLEWQRRAKKKIDQRV